MDNKKAQEELISTYDQIASFDQNRPVKNWSGSAVLKDLITEGNILDLGCGDGRIFEIFKNNKNITYTGIDFSPKSIEAARKKYGKYKNADFIILDILRPFPDTLIAKRWTLILLIGSYHHIFNKKDRLELLKKCKKLLDNNGAIVITIWNIWHPKNLMAVIKAKSLNAPYPFTINSKTIYRTYRLFFPWQIRREIQSAGLKIIKTDYWRGKKNLVLFCHNK